MESILNPTYTLKKKNSDEIKEFAYRSYYQLIDIQKKGIQFVWNNQDGLTPQEVCDALGNNAVKIFEFHSGITDFLITVAAKDGISPDINLPTKNFNKNLDGTVTILDEPYSP